LGNSADVLILGMFLLFDDDLEQLPPKYLGYWKGVAES
jgi:hypothetical protein